jgi:Spy/CpxP family protein refolding chaperone
MNMMKPMKTATLTALLVISGTPIFAQQPDSTRERGAVQHFGRSHGVGVEAALRMREQLKLNESQVSQLESLRKQAVEQRQNEAREMIDLSSRIEAGLLDRDAARKQMESRREAIKGVMEQRRAQLEKILTPEQREEFLRMQKQGRGKHMRAPRARDGFERGLREPPMRGRYRF